MCLGYMKFPLTDNTISILLNFAQRKWRSVWRQYLNFNMLPEIKDLFSTSFNRVGLNRKEFKHNISTVI